MNYEERLTIHRLIERYGFKHVWATLSRIGEDYNVRALDKVCTHCNVSKPPIEYHTSGSRICLPCQLKMPTRWWSEFANSARQRGIPVPATKPKLRQE